MNAMSPVTTCPGATAPCPKRLSHARALWLKASILVTFLAAASAPSPLYAIYREAWGFSALTLTVVFSSYAFAMLAALLVFGALSDHRGRREVLLAALVLEFAAMLLFWGAESVGWLLAARILQGVATGIATSALSAGLLDLHRERGALVNSLAPPIGLGVGALGTSALVQFAPAPTELVFDLLLLVIALQTLAALYLPETVERRPGAWRSLMPSISIPAQARTTMWQVAPVNTAQWALLGFYLSLGPTLARIVTGNEAPVVGGALVAALVLSSVVGLLLVRQQAPRSALVAGAAALAIGVGVTLAGIQLHSTAAFFVGTVISGLGFGAAFNGSIRSLVPLAATHERAGLMSGFFVLSYLAFSLPAVAAGLFAGHVGLQTTTMGYGLALMAMAMAAAALLAMERRPAA
jgi:predicted MFS family arabinose efflux permease